MSWVLVMLAPVLGAGARLSSMSMSAVLAFWEAGRHAEIRGGFVALQEASISPLPARNTRGRCARCRGLFLVGLRTLIHLISRSSKNTPERLVFVKGAAACLGVHLKVAPTLDSAAVAALVSRVREAAVWSLRGCLPRCRAGADQGA